MSPCHWLHYSIQCVSREKKNVSNVLKQRWVSAKHCKWLSSLVFDISGHLHIITFCSCHSHCLLGHSSSHAEGRDPERACSSLSAGGAQGDRLTYRHVHVARCISLRVLWLESSGSLPEGHRRGLWHQLPDPVLSWVLLHWEGAAEAKTCFPVAPLQAWCATQCAENWCPIIGTRSPASASS